MNKEKEAYPLLEIMKLAPLLKALNGGGGESGEEQILFFNSYIELPPVGDPTKVYVVGKEKVYTYNAGSGGYTCISFPEPDTIQGNF